MEAEARHLQVTSFIKHYVSSCRLSYFCTLLCSGLTTGKASKSPSHSHVQRSCLHLGRAGNMLQAEANHLHAMTCIYND